MDIVPVPGRGKVEITPQTAVFLKERQSQTAAAFKIRIVAAQCFDLLCQSDPVVEQQRLVRESGVSGVRQLQIGTEKSSGAPADAGSPPTIAQGGSSHEEHNADPREENPPENSFIFSHRYLIPKIVKNPQSPE